jgi:hypothetical protein
MIKFSRISLAISIVSFASFFIVNFFSHSLLLMLLAPLLLIATVLFSLISIIFLLTRYQKQFVLRLALTAAIFFSALVLLIRACTI